MSDIIVVEVTEQSPQPPIEIKVDLNSAALAYSYYLGAQSVYNQMLELLNNSTGGVPDATSSVKGKMFLFDSLGISPFGAISQRAATLSFSELGSLIDDALTAADDAMTAADAAQDDADDAALDAATAQGTANNALEQAALKLPILTPTATGTVVAFDFDKVYGTISTPVAGNITKNTTGAKLGVVAKMIHNSSVAPTFDAAFKKSNGSFDYAPGLTNFISFEYFDANNIIYSIHQLA